MAATDYVLGTGDEEIARLGQQHRIWRSHAMDAWARAGIRPGSRVVVAGAGPGYSTIDLAELVGASGEVLAVERSTRFLEFLRAEAEHRGFANIRTSEADLSIDSIDATDTDVVWCRWVASFVASPAALVKSIAGALRPGGMAVFHEYANYGAWQLLPPRKSFDAFVAEVIASWRAAAGEPDIARLLPSLLMSAGCRVVSARPLIFAARPGDPMWEWPAAFLRSGLQRLQSLGLVDDAFAKTVRDDFDGAERDSATVMITPLVLELVAQRTG